MHIFFLKCSVKDTDRKQSSNRQFHLKASERSHLQLSDSKYMKFSLSSNFFMMDVKYLPETQYFIRLLHKKYF